MRDSIRQTYATGAYAADTYGTLTVAVPAEDHPSRTRSSALQLARCVWGARAVIRVNLGPVKVLHPYNGKETRMTRYAVVIIGTPEECATARARGLYKMGA